MSRLRDNHVSCMDDIARFTKRMAEIVTDCGGDLDQILCRFNSNYAFDRSSVGIALTDLMVEKGSSHPFDIAPIEGPLDQVLPGLEKREIPENWWEGLKDGDAKASPGQFQLFKPFFYSMSMNQCINFMLSRGYRLPTAREMASMPENVLSWITHYPSYQTTIYRSKTSDDEWEGIPAIAVNWEKNKDNIWEKTFSWVTSREAQIKVGEFFLVKIPKKN